MAANDKAQPGDPLKISATAWNNAVDAGEYHARNKRLGEGVTPAPFGTVPIKVRNNTGDDRRAGEVVGIGSLILDELTKQYMWFGSASPAECEPFGIYVRPTPDGGIEAVSVAGACKALVNITDTCHRFANVSDGEYVLQSDDTGPVRIIYAPSGTGEKTCLVAFSWDLRGCPTCDDSSGSSGSSGSSESGCPVSVRSFGLDGVENYNPLGRQILMHDEGCLRWEDVVECDNTSGSDDTSALPEGCIDGTCDNAPCFATYDGEAWVPDAGFVCPDGYFAQTDPPGATGYVGETRPIVCCPLPE